MLEKVKALVLQASEFMKADHYDIFEKDGLSNIVTSTDINVQKFLEEKLLQLLPESGFLGEESAPENIGREYCWIVDPVDGTQNYARRLRESCISVALRKGSEIVMGIVYNPFKDEMFWAERGKGSFLNGRRLSVSKMPFGNCILFTALSLYRKQNAGICNQVIMDLYPRINDIRRFGAAALELCYIADGRGDLYFEHGLFPWDFAAAWLILQEAGGVLGSFEGTPDLTDRCMIFAANNQENFQELEKTIHKYIKEY